MSNSYDPPRVTFPEVAKVSVGFTVSGHLTVKVTGTRRITDLSGLEEMFGRAAAAFLREFSQGNPLLATAKDKGYNAALEQVTDELAADHNVPVIDRRVRGE